MNEDSNTTERGSGGAPARKAAQHAEMVRGMRAHWQREAEAGRAGDAAAAARAKARGDREFVSLIDALRPSLSQIAHAYFHDGALTADGVSEMTVALYEKLRDLSGTASAKGWENPAAFWTALKNNASNLFLRRKQREYGRHRSGPDTESVTDTNGGEKEEAGGSEKQVRSNSGRAVEVRQSELLPSPGQEGPQGEPSFDRVADAPDLKSESPFRALLAGDELGALLHSITNPLHRRALLLEIEGVPQTEIARTLGVTDRSVRNYLRAAREQAVAWAARRYREHDEFSDWFGGDGDTSTDSDSG